MTAEFDVIVIGGGSAGQNAGGRAAERGLDVALVEQDLVGGECSYWACMPSKALLRPAEALAAVRRVPGAREAVTGTLNVDAVLARRNKLAANWDDEGQASWVAGAGMTLVRGHGRLAGERRVTVETADGGTRELAARRGVVLATGSGAAYPPIEGLRDIRTWDNRDATTAKEVPARLLVLGGGAVGVELAQAWSRLGAREVTVVEMLPRLLANEEPFASEQLTEAFHDEGITVHVGAKMAKVTRAADDAPVTAVLDGGPTVESDEILVAAGRRPRTDDLGLDTVGLEAGRSLAVDDQLRVTGVPGGWLYAVGDVNGRALLTHMGKYQARLAGDHLAGDEVEAYADHSAVPRVVFTDPQVAAVGLTEKGAREQGLHVRTASYDFRGISGAATAGQGTRGSAKIVVDAQRNVIVGTTFTGPGVGELLHAATVAIVGQVPLERLWHAVPSFPTLSEVWLRLLETYGL